MTRDVSVPGRQLGRVLRELRVGAGLTARSAAQALEWTPNRLGRIENGLGTVRGRDVQALCELYGARPEMTAGLVRLAGDVGARGWWRSHGDARADGFDLCAGMEAAASRLREYQSAVVPTLLRTPEYAHALAAGLPGVSRGDRERLVAAWAARQSVLGRAVPAAPRVEVMVCEAVLLGRRFGAGVMAGQLRHLLERERVSVRVVPLAAGAHLGAVAGSFVLLEFPPSGPRVESDPPVVCRESLTGSLYLGREEEIAAYERVWADLDALALDEEASRRLISEIIERVHGQ